MPHKKKLMSPNTNSVGNLQLGSTLPFQVHSHLCAALFMSHTHILIYAQLCTVTNK